ncbi:hypothetical protein O1611_g5569 [Lasiodiplodia mahajangana]|uniref:Uncharacterized protein n=1 Tax=Lasiodiplodia mahajangana TaxID=1108764 RepID=A0ACC2JLD1_9PEZI|nr:hypothetical protein O1611_g5569 [Lasiodiplodia mahajangana]
MHSSNDSAWILRLSNELLLSVFEYDLTPATLTERALCCKRWNKLATLVLYKHVALTSTQKVSRWISTAPSSLDPTIETLTICITNVSTTSDVDVIAMEQLRLDLDQLPSRLRQMVKLRSFSVSTPERLNPGLQVSEISMAKLLHDVPETCSSLELAIKPRALVASPGEQKVHLCVLIRQLMPQLQFLRISLPCLCPESFGYVHSQSSTNTPVFTPAQAPNLRDCIFLLASPSGGGGIVRFDEPCNPDVSISGVKAFVECLLILVRSGQAPLLEKLWVFDALPKRGRNDNASYEAFVRRDILTQMSHTFPGNFITPPRIAHGFFIRMPAEDGGEDFVTTRQGAASIVERHAWMAATNGARLPATLMAKYRLPRQDCTVQARAEWSTNNKHSTPLWSNERTAGMKLLEGETGALREDRPALFRIPEGWRQDPLGFLERIS